MVANDELIQELTKEQNTLKVDAYIGTFVRGEYRYLVSLSTQNDTVIFEFCEN